MVEQEHAAPGPAPRRSASGWAVIKATVYVATKYTSKQLCLGAPRGTPDCASWQTPSPLRGSLSASACAPGQPGQAGRARSISRVTAATKHERAGVSANETRRRKPQAVGPFLPPSPRKNTRERGSTASDSAFHHTEAEREILGSYGVCLAVVEGCVCVVGGHRQIKGACTLLVHTGGRKPAQKKGW